MLCLPIRDSFDFELTAGTLFPNPFALNVIVCLRHMQQGVTIGLVVLQDLVCLATDLLPREDDVPRLRHATAHREAENVLIPERSSDDVNVLTCH